MSSPDLTPFVDLRLLDQDPQDIFDKAITNLQSHLPDWVPREGATEVMLLESLAQEVAEACMAINRLPGTIFSVLQRSYGITRSEGVYPTTTITVTASDTLGHTLPVGTRFAYVMPDNSLLVFVADSTVTIDPGSDTETFAATATTYTDEANDTAAGANLQILDSVPYLAAAETASEIENGSGPESDADYFARSAQSFARLTDTLLLPSHFEMAALQFPFVYRAYAADMTDADEGTDPIFPGYLSLAVRGISGNLTSPQKTELRDYMEPRMMSGLILRIIDTTVYDIDVTATVKGLSTYDPVVVEANVVEALTNYLSPLTWDWSDTVRRNELITLMSNTEGVDYVVSLSIPDPDTVLDPAIGILVDVGTLDITVT